AVDADDEIGRAAVDGARFVHEGPLSFAFADDFKAPQAGLFGRPAGQQRGNQEAFVGFGHAGDAGFGAGDVAVGDQFGDNAGDDAGGNGEADAGVLAVLAGDGGGYADDASAAIEQRAAGVA